jgi:preprotein translocase subunit SecE
MSNLSEVLVETKRERIGNKIFKRRSWNPKFYNRIRKEVATVVWPRRKSSYNRNSEKCIKIKV